MIDKGIKEKYPSFDFNEVEKYMSCYQDRYYGRLVSKRAEPYRLLGHNGIKFLLNSLQRSRCIFTGFADCVNRTHCALAFLATRAHFETTGSVAYFLRYLRRFYDGKIKYQEIDDVLYKLSLGGRTFPEKSTHPNRPDAVNVLTQIDAADKLYAEMGGQIAKLFRDCYDFLSEFCHPNFFGSTIGADIVDRGTVVYYENPRFKHEDFGILINHMVMSCGFFFHVYDESFSLIKSNEEMPDLVKSEFGR